MAFGKDAWLFTGPDGREKRRRRITTPGKTFVPDLDAMGLEEIQDLIGRAKVTPKPMLYQSMFPERPLGFPKAARLFLAMLHMREEFLIKGSARYQEAYEKFYRRLPAWAQWRYKYNVLAAVPPGGKLRKRPRP